MHFYLSQNGELDILASLKTATAPLTKAEKTLR